MGTKNDPGAFDCYAKAAADEPMFILLARDRHAELLVRVWALLRERDGEAPESVAEARRCATAMARWALEHDRPRVYESLAPLVLDAIVRKYEEGKPS